jgi:hypothetical protein
MSAIFQYSVGDAAETYVVPRLQISTAFNTPLEMLGVLVVGCCGFLSFVDCGVWVSCGGLLTVVVLVLSLYWCAEKRGVGVCVFFSSASACAEELHDVL